MKKPVEIPDPRKAMYGLAGDWLTYERERPGTVGFLAGDKPSPKSDLILEKETFVVTLEREITISVVRGDEYGTKDYPNGAVVLNSTSTGLFAPGDLVYCPGLENLIPGEMTNLHCKVKGGVMTLIGINKRKTVISTTTFTGKVIRLVNGLKSDTNEESVSNMNTKNAETNELVDGFYVEPDARLVFTSAKKLSDSMPERAVKVMMVGPSGYGKTEMPRIFAKRVGMDYMRMNCASIRDPEEWFGYREAQNGSTVFIRSLFAKAIEAGNVVVVLDEFNRLEPWLHNTLYPLLDQDGKTTVHGETFTIGPNVIVVGTINVGHRFTGTFELDEALMNRFNLVLEVGPLPYAEEVRVLVANTGITKSLAEIVVKTANKLRAINTACSTRTTLDVGRMVVLGMDVRQAFESSVVKRIPNETFGTNLRKQAADILNTSLGAIVNESIVGDVFSNSATPEPEDELVLVQEHTPVLLTAPLVEASILNLVLDPSYNDSFLMAQFTRLIRSLPREKPLALAEAIKIADALRNQEVVGYQLYIYNSEQLTEAIEAFSQLGIIATAYHTGF